MGQILSYRDRAYRKLEQICVTRYYDKYSSGQDNAGVYKQMEKELSYIRQQGSAPLIIEVYEALTAIEAGYKDFCLRGAEGASVVLYIMGISKIEPISVRPKVYPEFCFGLDGEKELSIELSVTTKLYEKLIRYFNHYMGEARVRYNHSSDGTLYRVSFSDPLDADDTMGFSFVFRPISNPKTVAKKHFTGEPFEVVKPKTFEEQIKCMCWSLFDNGTWEGNGLELYKTGKAKVEELISNREDVFEYLILHGIDRKVAFGIAEDIRLGRINRRGWNEKTRLLLSDAGIPEWYLQSCEKIGTLSSRMHAITMLKHFGTYLKKER